MDTRLLQIAIAAETDIVLVRSARAGWPSCSASTRRTRRASPPRSRRSPATPSSMRGGGQVEFRLTGEPPAQSFVIVVRDAGPGIADLDGGAGRLAPVRDRHGPRPARRAAADGRVRHRRRARRGHDGAARQDAAAHGAARSRRRSSRASCDALAADGPADAAGGDQPAEPGDPAAARGAAGAPGGAGSGSTRSWRTPTAASSRCTPSSTSAPTTCAAPTS